VVLRRALTLVTTLGLIAAPRAHAQGAPRVVGTSANAWFDVTSDVWVTPTLDLQAGGKIQRSELGARPQQMELRAGLLRSLGAKTKIGGGVLVAHNSPYGPFPARAPYGELRLWQQIQRDQHAGRFALGHRLRVEERWIQRPLGPVGDLAVDADVQYAMRLRYQLKATTPLGGAQAAHPLYALAYDEVLTSVGPHASPNAIDQNRAAVGLGLRWTTAMRGEASYVNQRILRADGRQLEHGHTLQLALVLTRLAPHR
jgi:hypothetical protein